MSQLPDDQIMVSMRHVRAADLCSRGSRNWFEKYGLSWNEFLTTGISADRILATGDAFAVRVVDIARAESNRE